jgi:Raf kinase inhibitor-like YbhB/YbcL family protein
MPDRTQAAVPRPARRSAPRLSPRAVAALLLALPLLGAAGGRAVAAEKGDDAMSLALTSPHFSPQGEIPTRFTCEGEDVSPALAWSGLPAATKSPALIVDDPDAPDPRAPRTTWVHWVLYDLPPSASGLDEATSAGGLPPGTRQGLNDWKRTGWGGPCPPIGRHRYFFKLYALDAVLPDLGEPSKARLEQAMQGHVLAETQLVGTYQKKK